MVNCGDTFLLEDEDGYDQHLCIVVTPPYENKVAVVSVTTRRAKSETLTILQAGVHPFIEHESVISYGYSRVVDVDYIETAVNSGDASRKEPASAELLKRAQDGLAESEFCPYKVRLFVKDATNS